MTSLACLINVLVVLVMPYFYPFDLHLLLLSLALDFKYIRILDLYVLIITSFLLLY
jgi:hypothetical protein